jgi:hypothetical protein
MLTRTILVGAFLAWTLTAVAHAQARQDSSAASSPDADGAKLITAQCAGICHGSDRFGFTRHSPEEWRRIVLQMVSNGAQLFPDDIETIARYFAANFSDKGTSAGGNR